MERGSAITEIRDICQRLADESGAKIVFLVEASKGKLIAWVGEAERLDSAGLASLLARSFKMAGGFQKLIEDEEFAHESTEAADSFYINLLLKRLMLVVIFDQRTSLRKVRPRARSAATEIATRWPAI